jgi:hypothetical protein
VSNNCNDVRSTTPEGRYFNITHAHRSRNFNTCSFRTAW